MAATDLGHVAVTSDLDRAGGVTPDHGGVPEDPIERIKARWAAEDRLWDALHGAGVDLRLPAGCTDVSELVELGVDVVEALAEENAGGEYSRAWVMSRAEGAIFWSGWEKGYRPARPVRQTGLDPVLAPRPATTPTTPACTASWYGEAHRGLPTASGVPFDPDAFTAASWDHPFGTRLQVAHAGRAVTVVVNDRGPARRLGRCIDLSAAAFEILAPLNAGLIDVTVQVSP